MKKEDKYADEFFRTGMQVGRKVHALIHSYMQEYGLNATDISVLGMLKCGNADTAREIVEETGFSRALVSKTVDTLLKRDYIEAKQDENDRRVVRLYVKNKGIALDERMNTQRSEFERDLWCGISLQDQKTALNVMKKLCGNMDEISRIKSEETE